MNILENQYSAGDEGRALMMSEPKTQEVLGGLLGPKWDSPWLPVILSWLTLFQPPWSPHCTLHRPDTPQPGTFLLEVILRLTSSLHSVHSCHFQKGSSCSQKLPSLFIALPCFKVGTVLTALEHKGCLLLWLRAWVQILNLLLPNWVTSSKFFMLPVLHFSHLVLTVAHFIGWFLCLHWLPLVVANFIGVSATPSALTPEELQCRGSGTHHAYALRMASHWKHLRSSARKHPLAQGASSAYMWGRQEVPRVKTLGNGFDTVMNKSLKDNTSVSSALGWTIWSQLCTRGLQLDWAPEAHSPVLHILTRPSRGPFIPKLFALKC